MQLSLLTFERSETDDGLIVLEALASLRAEAADAGHAALAEAETVLAWVRARFGVPGPLEQGHGWDHDLQQHTEADGWCTVALTLTGPAGFMTGLIEALQAACPQALADGEP